MTTRIEMDNGKFIEIKDVAELRAGDKRAALASVPVEIDSETGNQILPGDYNHRMQMALAARIITSWNLDFNVPNGDPRVLDKLTFEQEGKLIAALDPYVALLNSQQADPTVPGTDPTVA